jgi:hypothetical protein
MIQDFLFVPNMIPGGHGPNPQGEQFVGQTRRDPEPRGSVLAVGQDQINRMMARLICQVIVQGRPAGAAEDVSNE